MDAVCEAILKAFAKNKFPVLKKLTSISPKPTTGDAATAACETATLSATDSAANSVDAAKAAQTLAAKSKKKSKAKEAVVDSFCQPRLTASDLKDVRSWITLQLFPHQIIWVKFAVAEKVEEEEYRLQEEEETSGHIDEISPETKHSHGLEGVEVGKKTEVILEAWNREDFGLSDNDLNSKYNHAKYFQRVKDVLDRFVMDCDLNVDLSTIFVGEFE